MQFSNRMKEFDLNIFSKLLDKRRELEKQGMEVIDLSVGTPDFEPDNHVIKAMADACLDKENYKYSIADSKALIQSVISWYKRRYDVTLTEEEITSVYGSQEGVAHIAFPLINDGDVVIAGEPCYPVFKYGPLLAGANMHFTPLLEKNNYLIDFKSIDEDIAKKAKVIMVSYPNNPVTATAPKSFYEDLVSWAKRYDVTVIHDNAYSELVIDEKPGISFLSIKGAKDVGIEFNSLSKSYNLTGIRISFALGNKEIIKRFKQVRSQIDYGISYPVQKAAISALNGNQDILDKNREGYKSRGKTLCSGLREIGWDVKNPSATMFVWAKLPKGYEKSFDFVMELMEKTGIICTPGDSFGHMGEGYVRFALVRDEEVMRRVVRLIDKSGMILSD